MKPPRWAAQPRPTRRISAAATNRGEDLSRRLLQRGGLPATKAARLLSFRHLAAFASDLIDSRTSWGATSTRGAGNDLLRRPSRRLPHVAVVLDELEDRQPRRVL